MTRLLRTASTLLFCLAAPVAVSETVTFADPNLEDAVREAFVDLGTPLGTEIDSSDLVGAGFVQLDASNRGIVDLGGIEHATDLLVLDLGGNDIVDVSPLAALVNLVNLNLGYGNPFETDNFPVASGVQNDISDISSLSTLTNLLIFNVGGNPGLSDISVVSNFTGLQQLYLGFQPIASLAPLAGLNQIEAFIADECGLNDGNLSAIADYSGVSVLSLNGNFLTTLAPIGTATNLTVLAASGNQITNINAVAGFTDLDILLLGENLFTSLQPLIDNSGIGGDDIVVISGNPLSQSAACDEIPVLEARFNDPANLVTDAVCTDDVTLNVSVTGDGSTIPPAGATLYPPNSEQTVLAIPNPGSGFAFDRWQGDLNTTDSAAQILMNGNKSIEAVFVSPGDHTLNLSLAGAGSGNTIPAPGVTSYLDGRNAILSANPEPGNFFGGWSGDITSINSFVQVPMDGNKNITATFATSGFTLNLNQIGQGSISPGPGSYALASGLEVTLNAGETVFGWSFDRWQGDIGANDPNDPTITVTMDQSRSISAIFLLDDFDFILNIGVTGTGMTDPEPGSYGQLEGDIVDVNAVGIPGSGFAFDRWEGAVNSTDEFISVTIEGPTNLEAVFVPQEVTLDLSTAGAGSGSVFPTEGVQGYLQGRTARLAAFTAPGSFFAGWSGDVTSLNPFEEILMDGNKTVVANFTTTGFSLNLGTQGVGFTEPNPGTYNFGAGAQVTLRAVELQSSWVFDRWLGNLGGADPFSPEITVTMNQARDITARFIRMFSLTVENIGPGETVPLGAGVYQFLDQTFVNLEAIPDEGAFFDRWETVGTPGATPGSRFISVLMNSNATVRAIFQEADTILDINVEGQGITDPLPGQYPFELNEVAVVEAVNVNGTGYFFRHWEGDIGPADPFNPILSVTMDGNRSVTAIFEEGLPGEGEGEEGELEGEPAELLCEVSLSQASVVPPTISNRTGTAVFEYFPTPELVRVTVEHNIPNPTAAVIGRAAPGGNGPFVFNLGNPTSPVEFFMSMEDYESVDFNHYVMVFSADFLQGEIRGNILCGEPSEEGEGEGAEGEGELEGLSIEGEEDGTLLCQLPASGDLLSPPNATQAVGVVSFYTTEDPEQILFRVDHNVPNPTAALVRMGQPGENGLSIIVNMGDPSSPVRTVISAEDYELIRTGHYLTIHSFQDLQGAIRADFSCPSLHGEEGEPEGQPEGQTEGDPEGDPEGQVPVEGEPEGDPEGQVPVEGEPEGQTDGEADGEVPVEGEPEGDPEGQVPVEGELTFNHSADQNGDGMVNLSELLRVIQIFNVGSYHCDPLGEDGFGLGDDGPRDCAAHSSDYNPQDWIISLSELLRLIQIFNSSGYFDCPNNPNSEDGFCLIL